MQAAVSKQCEATVGGFNNTQSAAGGLLASTAYGSLEIMMRIYEQKSDHRCSHGMYLQHYKANRFFFSLMSGYYGVVGDDKL